MWELPDGKVVKFPKPIKVNDVNHPAGIFTQWSTGELAAIGIREYKEQKIDERHFKKIGQHTIQDLTTVEKRFIVEPKFTLVQLKIKKLQTADDVVSIQYKLLCEQLAFQKEFYPNDDVLAIILEDKIAVLKIGLNNIRLDLEKITDYQELIDYNFLERLEY